MSFQRGRASETAKSSRTGISLVQYDKPARTSPSRRSRSLPTPRPPKADGDDSGHESADSEVYIRSGRPIVSRVAPSGLRDLLKRDAKQLDAGALGIRTVETQLAIHELHKQAARDSSEKAATLFDLAAASLGQTIGDDPERDAEVLAALPSAVLKRSIWRFGKLTYHVVCSMRSQFEGGGGLEPPSKRVRVEDEPGMDVDEWILRNEDWMRSDKLSDWRAGLIRLSQPMDVLFAQSSVSGTARTITRPKYLPGFCFLDWKKAPKVSICATTAAFKRNFDTLTGGLLKGLDWSNVIVAGGMVLGALLATPNAAATGWANSDIDVYLYGLGPKEANAKLQSIYKTFKANLPKRAPTLVVRNSRTITLMSDYPTRRIQIILKLVSDPRQVLLNFDLDPCSCAFDGTEVWMLPRAVRALETGYSTFTTNLVDGHYLGERRASQEQRVFKYANKGYGIRILPSYIESLGTSVNLADIKQTSAAYTRELVKRYSKSITLRKKGGLPVYSHAKLDNRFQRSSQPCDRSSLSGFSLLMRHVALWEAECRAELVIDEEVWATTVYEDPTFSYDDMPRYKWNSSFTIDGFCKFIDSFNQDACDRVDQAMEWMDLEMEDEHFRSIRRIVYGSAMTNVFKHDILFCVLMPPIFAEFANKMIADALADAGLPAAHGGALQEAKLQVEHTSRRNSEDPSRWTFWNVTSTTMWQQLDRRIDECHEVIWSFHHANTLLNVEPEDRFHRLRNQISKRAIKLRPDDEFKSFKLWVARKPVLANEGPWYLQDKFYRLTLEEGPMNHKYDEGDSDESDEGDEDYASHEDDEDEDRFL